MISRTMLPSPTTTLIALCIVVPIALHHVVVQVQANPKSRPYVAYRTSPFDQQEFVSRRIMEDGVEQRGVVTSGSEAVPLGEGER